MPYQINFGNISLAKSSPNPVKTRSFRIAVLGDFSGRANRGELETGEALAARKPIKVDCDNFDDVLERLGIKIALPFGDASLEIEVASLDDLHPDRLYEKLPIFSALASLRARLKSTSTFAKAAQEVQGWAGEFGTGLEPNQDIARGFAVPVDGKLSDFAQLMGRPSAPATSEDAVTSLIKKIVAPQVVAAKDPRQDAMVAAVDKALTGMMRDILHHPDFQAMESLWRSVDFLVRRLETDTQLQIVLLDISAEELVADLSREDGLENSGLYQLLVEQPTLDARQGAYSLVVGNYLFDHTPPHAEVIGRLARIAAQARAPFVAAMAPDCMDAKAGHVHPLISEAWNALRAMPESAYVGLTLPRFMLRFPYGKKTEPIDSFAFEEFAPHVGLRAMLWGNSAILVALLLGTSFTKGGAKMNTRSALSVDELPFYYYTDKDGDQIALPCTERLVTTRVASLLTDMGFMPVLAVKGSPEVRLVGFHSLAGRELAGWWTASAAAATPTEEAAPAEEVPEEVPAGSAAERVSEETAIETYGEAPEEGATEMPAADDAPAESGTSDLDSLLASMSTPEPPAREGETASDLDKMLGDLGSS